MKFHGLQINEPMSRQLLVDDFEETPLGKLKLASDGNIKLNLVPHDYRGAEYAWRVVDISISQEDATMTRFRAFDLEGQMRPEATFGVWYSSLNAEIKGYFEYQPVHGTQYYVPQDNRFMTPNTGGYEVQVLDKDFPSESLEFGLIKSGTKHDALIIDFRLMKLDKENYP